MIKELTRREWLACSLCLSSALAAEAPAWNRPVPLGKSGLGVTRLGMGCQSAGSDLIRRAVECGINYFNCFTGKGDLSHLPVVAEALKPVRRRVVLGAGSSERTKEGFLNDLDRQLRAFGTDYIDLWYIIAAMKPDDISDDVLEAFRIARQAGKIRAAAMSTHGFEAVIPRVLEVRQIDAIMATCNSAIWSTRAENFAKLHTAGIGVVAMKPMMGGFNMVPKEKRAWVDSLDTEAKRLAALAAALKWLMRNKYVDTAPVTVTSIEQLERNVKAAAEPFTDSDSRILEIELAKNSPYYCRMCQRCEGSCRQGLPVSDVIRFLMYAEGYGEMRMARQGFEQLPPGVISARCDSCSGCTVRCPNGVRVREQVSRALSVLA